MQHGPPEVNRWRRASFNVWYGLVSRNAFAPLAGYVLAVVGVWFGLRGAGVGVPWRMVAVLILGGLFLFHVFSRVPPSERRPGEAEDEVPGAA